MISKHETNEPGRRLGGPSGALPWSTSALETFLHGRSRRVLLNPPALDPARRNELHDVGSVRPSPGSALPACQREPGGGSTFWSIAAHSASRPSASSFCAKASAVSTSFSASLVACATDCSVGCRWRRAAVDSGTVPTILPFARA